MKRSLLLHFLLIASLSFAQHPELFNTNWQVTKIANEIMPEQLPPPMPYQQVTHFSEDSPQLEVSFFNMVSADLTFEEYDAFHTFTLNNKDCTIADYFGDNGEVNQFFDLLCGFFRNNDTYQPEFD